MSGTYNTPPNSNIYTSTYDRAGTGLNNDQTATYTAYNNYQYQDVTYPGTTTYPGYNTTHDNTGYNSATVSATHDNTGYNSAAAVNPTYGNTLATYNTNSESGVALDVPGTSSKNTRTVYRTNAPFPSFRQKKRGQGGGGKWPARKKSAPKPFSCTNQHPVAALKHLHPAAEFAVVCTYHVTGGSAHVYSITIDGVIYQGEGTTSKISKAIAATKALEGMQALDYDKVEVVADYQQQKEEVLKRIQVWQHNYAAKEGRKKQRQEEEKERFNSSKRKRDESIEEKAEEKVEEKVDAKGPEKGPLIPRYDPEIDITAESQVKKAVRDYGQLIQKYGPDISEEYTELQRGLVVYNCTLTIQGSKFSGEGRSKKKARNHAVDLAFQAFDETPPPIVHVKQATPDRRAHKKFTIVQPVEFPDKLAEKCWTFTSEKLASIQPAYKHLKNLVVIVKMEGEETLDNCEIVAFGNGTRLINIENTTTDGTLVNDSTGDSLALRALRRYLVSQLDECLCNNPSVYQRGTDNKFSIREGVQFLFYTNNCPNGDCRVVVHIPPNVEHTSTEPTSEVKVESTSEVKMEPTSEVKVEPTSEVKVEPTSEVKVEPTATQHDKTEPGVSATTYSIKTDIETVTYSATDPSSTDPSCGDAPSTSLPTTAESGRRRRMFRRRPKGYKGVVLEDLGKLGYSKRDLSEASLEMSNSLILMTPSDKLALRNMCGVQGSLLSTISTPVYITQYLVTFRFNEDALRRGLYDRVKGAVLPEHLAVSPAEPEIKRVRWRATQFLEKTSLWASIWAKGCPLETLFTCEGKQFDGTQDNIDSNHIVELGILQQSSYCTQHMFTEYKDLCARRSLHCEDKYSDIKYCDNSYRAVKTAVCKHFEESGLGRWNERQKPDF